MTSVNSDIARPRRDSELRRRHPGKPIEPLRSAEPRVPDDGQITTAQPEARPAETPEWVAQLAGQRRAFRDKLEQRQNVMVPAEDPDYGFLGEAWLVWGAQRDAILQPPKPDLRPLSGIERPAGYEIPKPEAGA